MSENNQMMSVEGQIVGMPLAGPESFSQQQIEYLKRALGVDETVLYEDASGALDSVPLNETLSNFEHVDIVWTDWTSSSCTRISRYMANSENFMLDGTWAGSSTSILIWSVAMVPNSTKTALSKNFARHITLNVPTTVNQANNVRIIKVIGIHRISGGNT